MNPEIVTISVRLPRVSKDDAQAAVDAIESIFDEYEVSDTARLELWDHYQTIASEALMRFGEFNPDIGYPEGNGRV
jgi:hypothetical protein